MLLQQTPFYMKISIRPSGAALKALSVIDHEEYKSAKAVLIHLSVTLPLNLYKSSRASQ